MAISALRRRDRPQGTCPACAADSVPAEWIGAPETRRGCSPPLAGLRAGHGAIALIETAVGTLAKPMAKPSAADPVSGAIFPSLSDTRSRSCEVGLR